VITSEALDRGVEQLMRARQLNLTRMQRPEQLRQLKREALDNLIRDELLWQQARRDGQVVGEREVERAIAQTRAQFKAPEAFARQLARDGHDERSYRDHVRRMLSADRAAQALVDAGAAVDDGEVEAFYRANAARFSRPEQLRLREILIRAPAGAERADARRRVDEVRARLAAGEPFDALARQVSDHPTRQWGGEHDPVARGQLVPALEAVAFALQPGELSAVVETEAGFHLLKLESRAPAVLRTLADVREGIREHLLQQRSREVLQREIAALRARSQVEVVLPP
jgi:parvulin-like peptidyl-prolyl isomerase